jgi:hypothetical protein
MLKLIMETRKEIENVYTQDKICIIYHSYASLLGVVDINITLTYNSYS